MAGGIIIGSGRASAIGRASRAGNTGNVVSERTMLRLPGLVHVFLADRGEKQYKGRFRWRSVISDAELIGAPAGGGATATSFNPVVTTVAALGDKKCVITGNDVRYRLLDRGGFAMVPTASDWSVVQVLYPGATNTANWNIFGTTGANYTSILRFYTDGKYRLYRNGSTVVTSTLTKSAATPVLAVTTWKQSTNTQILRLNGTEFINVVTATANPSSQFVLGGSQDTGGSPGNAGAGFAAVMIANVCLTDAGYAATLAGITNWANGKFGSVFL